MFVNHGEFKNSQFESQWKMKTWYKVVNPWKQDSSTERTMLWKMTSQSGVFPFSKIDNWIRTLHVQTYKEFEIMRMGDS